MSVPKFWEAAAVIVGLFTVKLQQEGKEQEEDKLEAEEVVKTLSDGPVVRSSARTVNHS